MEKFFKLKENGTSVKIEFIAGITTFGYHGLHHHGKSGNACHTF